MPGVLSHDALVFPRSLFLTYKLNKSRLSVRFFPPRCMQTQGTGGAASRHNTHHQTHPDKRLSFPGKALIKKKLTTAGYFNLHAAPLFPASYCDTRRV